MDTKQSSTAATSVRTWIRRGLLAILLLILIRLLLSGLWAWQLSRTIQRTESHLSQIQTGTIATSDAYLLLVGDLHTAETQSTWLRRSLWPFGTLAQRNQWFPNVAAVAMLVEGGNELLRAATVLEQALTPALQAEQLTSEQLPSDAVLNAVGQTAINHLEAAAQSRNRIQLAKLHPQLQSVIIQFDDVWALLNSATQSVEAAPVLLGIDAPHHILVLLQNADEMRATGGFITSTAYVILQDGEVQDVTMLSSNDPMIDRFDEIEYPSPPEPLWQFMNLPIWAFRDANWSPHFPTSAEQAAKFYANGRNVPVDTVIAIDQYALQDVVRVFNAVTLNDGRTISAENFIDFIHESWVEYSADSYKQRKDFILDYGPAFLDSVAVTLREDASVLMKLPTDRFLGYSRLPKVQMLFEALNMDGTVSQEQTDYIQIVNSNVGYNKADYNMRQEVNYHVSLANFNAPFAKLSVTYHNESESANLGICPNTLLPRTGTHYLQAANLCHANYLRIYLPDDSIMREYPTFPFPDDYELLPNMEESADTMRPIVDERGKEVVAGLVVTPPQATQTGTFVYELSPEQIYTQNEEMQQRYTLRVAKQPGVTPYPVRISIDLPYWHPLIAVYPTPQSRSATTLIYDVTLSHDLSIELTFDVR